MVVTSSCYVVDVANVGIINADVDDYVADIAAGAITAHSTTIFDITANARRYITDLYKSVGTLARQDDHRIPHDFVVDFCHELELAAAAIKWVRHNFDWNILSNHVLT